VKSCWKTEKPPQRNISLVRNILEKKKKTTSELKKNRAISNNDQTMDIDQSDSNTFVNHFLIAVSRQIAPATASQHLTRPPCARRLRVAGRRSRRERRSHAAPYSSLHPPRPPSRIPGGTGENWWPSPVSVFGACRSRAVSTVLLSSAGPLPSPKTLPCPFSPVRRACREHRILHLPYAFRRPRIERGRKRPSSRWPNERTAADGTWKQRSTVSQPSHFDYVVAVVIDGGQHLVDLT